MNPHSLYVMIARSKHFFFFAGEQILECDGTKLPSGNYVVSAWLANHTQSKMFRLVR